MKVIREPKHGDMIDCSESMYPCTMEVLGQKLDRTIRKSSTVYGYVLSGSAFIDYAGGEVKLKKGGFFALPGDFQIEAFQGLTILIERFGFRALPIFGSVESKGRLSYIDGCSDSMLVQPQRMGDPVFNYLHFPKNINQSQHTHPSVRLGIVALGSGKAYCTYHDWEEPLTEGCIFSLDEQELHSFRTTESETPMDVIAFHPDSDWGPTDGNHPMLNRTYIGNDFKGNSASMKGS